MFPLESLLKYPAVLVVGFLVTTLLTPAWVRLAPALGLVDRPGGRKVHDRTVPVGGGLVIFLAFHASCAVLFLVPWAPFAGQVAAGWWWRFAVLSSGVVVLGLCDDRWSMQPALKLLGQCAIGLAAFWLGVRLQNVLGFPVPTWLDLTLTIGWFLLWMNAFNLIDGIDGLATGIALIAAFGLALSLHFRKSPGDVLLLLGFVGACGGFLRHNFHPARVFLGDTGSLFLGFTLAMLAITTNSKGTFVATIGMPLLAVGIPLFDTVLAVWRRTIRRLLSQADGTGHMLRHLGTGDAEHLHHRLMRMGLKQRHVALALYGGTGVLVGVGLLASLFRDRALGILALAFLAFSYVVVRHLAWIELQATGEAVVQGISQPVRRNRAMLMYLVADLAILSLTLLVTHAAMQVLRLGGATDIRRVWLQSAPLDVGVPFLLLVLWRSYSRVWHLARITEYVMTWAAVVLGYAVAAALALVGQGSTQGLGVLLLRYWLLAGMAAPLIVGVRAVRRVALDMLQMQAGRARRPGVGTERAIVWGVGYRTTLFLRQCAFNPARARATRILGAFSHDVAVRGHYVHGLRVLGTLADVAGFVAERNVGVVYLVEEVDAEVLAQMRKIAAKRALRIVAWDMTEAVLDE